MLSYDPGGFLTRVTIQNDPGNKYAVSRSGSRNVESCPRTTIQRIIATVSIQTKTCDRVIIQR